MPYILHFHDRVIVVKYGGSAMHDPELRNNILRDVVLLKYVGMHPVIVHGGGPDINKRLKKRKIETKFIQGLRVTTKDVMRVVENVLGKKINPEIVQLIKKNGGKAKGFYGKKGKVIKARKQWVKNEKGNYVDIGFTGHVAGIRYRFLQKWMKQGKSYNINADSAAAEVAAHLDAAKLILLTDVNGVLDKKGQLLTKVDAKRAKSMIQKKVISGGMIPKIKCGLSAIKKGVEKVHIINGQIPHAVLLEIFTNRGIGTMVVK